jgi:hypothetical protein
MSTLHARCVLLTPAGAQDLADLSHLFEHTTSGPMLRCTSVDMDGAWLKLELQSTGDSPEIAIPAHCVRAVVKTTDLVAWGLAAETSRRPRPLSQDEATAFIRETIEQQPSSSGSEIPLELLRSLCATTPLGIFNAAIGALEEAGFFRRNASGTLILA